MQHWIFDREAEMLASWQEAMPTARILSRSEVSNIPGGEPGILWCRLRSGEAMDDVLSAIHGAPRYPLVLFCDEPSDAIVMKALEAGAAGCCNTHAAPEVLRQVALVVGNGGLWVGQSLLRQLVGSTARTLGQRSREEKRDDWAQLLSEREVQVARLVAGGASNKEVASQLSITERTVKAHLGAIFEKLSLRDRLQLSVRVNGLTV
ncbi:response regulator transcription factor [Dechloromonas hortensis]|uniref:response regulator transcription factor n=1 Tax=Dechloromonas hortensis TaxID=337779 RepID=UPI001292945E|nr:response regulator transcription factor [Dechloromonas hortensis]